MSRSSSGLLSSSPVTSTLRGGSATFASSFEPSYSSLTRPSSHRSLLRSTYVPQPTASYGSSSLAYSTSSIGYGSSSSSIRGHGSGIVGIGGSSVHPTHGSRDKWRSPALSGSVSSGSSMPKLRRSSDLAVTHRLPPSTMAAAGTGAKSMPDDRSAVLLLRSYHGGSDWDDSSSSSLGPPPREAGAVRHWPRSGSSGIGSFQQSSNRTSLPSLLPPTTASEPGHDLLTPEWRHGEVDRMDVGSGGTSNNPARHSRPASTRLQQAAATTAAGRIGCGGGSLELSRSGTACHDSHPPVLQFSTSAIQGLASEDTTRDPSCDIVKVRLDAHNGDVGLHNLGNTCFMSSVVQCLSSTYPLVQYIMQNGHAADLAKAAAMAATAGTTIKHGKLRGSLMEAFAKLIQSLWKNSRSTAIYPDDFKAQVQVYAPQFAGYSQHDAQEFLQHLLQGLHEDINVVAGHPSMPQAPQSKAGCDSYNSSVQAESNQASGLDIMLAAATNSSLSLAEPITEEQKRDNCWKAYRAAEDSRIVDLFAGQLRSTLTCSSCGYSSTTFEPFWDLSLTIPMQDGRGSQTVVSLRHCLEAFVDEEKLAGDERPVCDRCKVRTVCTKSLSIVRLPQILVLHLKRFTGERYRTKLNTEVEFPEKGLDLSICCPKGMPCCVYDLYAVINHTGTVYSGHYTASCKHPVSGAWRRFDDHRVSPTSSMSLVSSGAYVLFYEAKKDAIFQSSL